MYKNVRRMKGYKPRKRRTKKEMQWQRLHDFQHQISSHVGKFLVLIREGKQDQIQQAQQSAKSDLLKVSPPMQDIARQLGTHIYSSVRTYLDTVDALVHTQPSYVDPALVDRCYVASQQLEKEFHVA